MKRCAVFLWSVFFVEILLLGSISPYTAQGSIPMLTQVERIAPNRIKVSYDLPVEKSQATNPACYWIQDLEGDRPTGIATFGKNDTINSNNSLRTQVVTIQPIEGSETTYILTFKKEVGKGKAYRLISCYIGTTGVTNYTGQNGAINFRT